MSSHERFQVALGGPWPTRLSPGLPVATQAGPAALGSASGSGGPRNASASRRLSAVSLRPESAAGTAAGARLQHVIRKRQDGATGCERRGAAARGPAPEGSARRSASPGRFELGLVVHAEGAGCRCHRWAPSRWPAVCHRGRRHGGLRSLRLRPRSHKEPRKMCRIKVVSAATGIPVTTVLAARGSLPVFPPYFSRGPLSHPTRRAERPAAVDERHSQCSSSAVPRACEARLPEGTSSYRQRHASCKRGSSPASELGRATHNALTTSVQR